MLVNQQMINDFNDYNNLIKVNKWEVKSIPCEFARFKLCAIVSNSDKGNENIEVGLMYDIETTSINTLRLNLHGFCVTNKELRSRGSSYKWLSALINHLLTNELKDQEISSIVMLADKRNTPMIKIGLKLGFIITEIQRGIDSGDERLELTYSIYNHAKRKPIKDSMLIEDMIISMYQDYKGDNNRK